MAKSLRPFIGSKDFLVSRRFYRELGFEETEISPDLCVFRLGDLAFYLQDYYQKEWIENTMLFLEVQDANTWYTKLTALNLPARFDGVRVSPVKKEEWGQECFLHDPAGVLWHIGEFFPVDK